MNPSRKFAIARFPTPILNTPRFRDVFCQALPLDEQGLLRAVETVALPQTKFELIEQCAGHILRVKTADYEGGDLFVDERFLTPADFKTPERKRIWPNPELILHRMRSLIGSMYVWGGSWPCIPQMLDFYPPRALLNEKSLKTWIFQGVDCSGLLYWATDGCSPRNTSELVTFGKSLSIDGKSPKEIQAMLKPLDLIVWKGHVVIVLNSAETIESRGGFGVVKCDLLARLEEVFTGHKRRPVNFWDNTLDPKDLRFVINRFL
ncbi:MAG: peptidoglycan endopeptidase [Chlamydiales bacterium]|nr:peptidoglycan endopeptidase [Chlamydiales bacterium]